MCAFLHVTGLLWAHTATVLSRVYHRWHNLHNKTGSCYQYPLTYELFLFHLYIYSPVNIVNTCPQVSMTVIAGK